MPRQGWETNKAGGKGSAVARESDKSQPQPGCPAHPCIPLPCVPAARGSRAAAGTLSRCSRGAARPSLLRQGPAGAGPCRARRAWPRASTGSAPKPAVHPWPCGPGQAGRARGVRSERRPGSLAGRWMAAPLQFHIPFLPDKPRRIFINQSATLFNKNLLTYK